MSLRDEYGMACPGCGQDESIHIVATVWAELTPEGIGEAHDFEWDGDSICTCPQCSTIGRVSDFTVKDEPAEDAGHGGE